MASGKKMDEKTVARETIKSGRLNVHVHSDIKENIEVAARMSGLSVSDFVISAAAQAASQMIRNQHLLRISESEFARFVSALDEEAAPNEAALEAARRFNASTRFVKTPRVSG